MAKKIKRHFTIQSLVRLIIFLVIIFISIIFLSKSPKNNNNLDFKIPAILGEATKSAQFIEIQNNISPLIDRLIKYPETKFKEFQKQIIKSVSDNLINSIK